MHHPAKRSLAMCEHTGGVLRDFIVVIHRDICREHSLIGRPNCLMTEAANSLSAAAGAEFRHLGINRQSIFGLGHAWPNPKIDWRLIPRCRNSAPAAAESEFAASVMRQLGLPIRLCSRQMSRWMTTMKSRRTPPVCSHIAKERFAGWCILGSTLQLLQSV